MIHIRAKINFNIEEDLSKGKTLANLAAEYPAEVTCSEPDDKKLLFEAMLKDKLVTDDTIRLIRERAVTAV